MEAGGVEPPSEKARREENYVRIRLMVFDLRFKAGESGEGLARLDLDRRLRTEAFGLSRKNDAHSPPSAAPPAGPNSRLRLRRG